MSRTVYKLLAVLAALVPASALAECGGVICETIFINRLYVVAEGGVLVGTSGTETNLYCAPTSSIYLTLDTNLPSSKEAYSLLLAAHLQKSPVSIRINRDSSGCTITYVISDA